MTEGNAYYLSPPATAVPESNDVIRVPGGGVYSYADQVCQPESSLDASLLDYSTDSSSARLLAAFKHASEAVPDLQEWQIACAWTVLANPVDFILEATGAFFGYIWDEISSLLEFLWDIAVWSANLSDCQIRSVSAALLPGLSPEEVLSGSSCESYRDIWHLARGVAVAVNAVRSTEADIVDVFVELQALGVELLTEVLELVGDSDDDLKKWLRDLSGDASRLGQFQGTVQAAILVEVGTGGWARGAKIAKAGRASLEEAMELGEDAEKVSDLAKAIDKTEDQGELARITKLLETAFARARLRLSHRVTEGKLREAHQTLEKILRLDDLPLLIERLTQELEAENRMLRSTVGSYRELRKKTRQHNKGAISVYYAAAARDVEMASGDKTRALRQIEVEVETAHLAEHLLDVNHIIEQRMFDRFKNVFKERLGWDSPHDMAAIPLPTTEHNRSLQRFFERVGLTSRDLPGVDEIKSVTHVLQEKIVFGDKSTPVPEGGLVVTDETTALELVEAYERVYKEHFPNIYEVEDIHGVKAVRASFEEWKGKLQ